jgi:hypothetical protein
MRYIDSVFAWSRTPSASSQKASPSGSTAASTATSAVDSRRTSRSSSSGNRQREAIHLPDELIEEIISYLPSGKESQSTLAACCLLSWQWHSIAVPRLYEAPYLYGSNFDPFVRTICPSLNAHIRKSDLAGFVRTLNMGELVHQGSKSTTARLLGRTKAGLTAYVAPQSNFGINCLAALSKCIHLQSLDLSLLSESMSYYDLANTLKGMKQLRSLNFPRSATKNISPVHPNRMEWPPLLHSLTLSGDMYGFLWNDINTFDGRAPNVPPALTSLTLERCKMSTTEVMELLSVVGPKLRVLKANHMLEFSTTTSGHMDKIFLHCPNLESLSVAHGYLSSLLTSHLDLEILDHHPLHTLEIRSSDQGPAALPPEPDTVRVLKPSDIATSLTIGLLPKLRKIRFARRLDWGRPSSTGRDESEYFTAIDQFLKAHGEGSGEVLGDGDVGIFFFTG